MHAMFGNSMSMAQKSLDYLWAKQNVTMNNIANVDTPGYKAQYLTFENEFRNRLEAGKTGTSKEFSRLISNSHYVLHDTAGESARMDENNVNTDVESVELARTTLQYQHELNVFNNEVSRIRTMIKG